MPVERGLSRDRRGSCGSVVIAAVQCALGALGKGRLDLAAAALEDLLHLLELDEANPEF